MLAFMLDLVGKRVVVVGGGPVGRRKASLVQYEGCQVRVVALELRPHDWPHAASLEWLVEPYRREHLVGAALVFAAATPEVNSQIVLDAQSLGIWVNSASNPDDGDCLVPATLQRGMLQLAVSTQGASPSFARRIKEKLDAEFDTSFAEFVNLLDDIRDVVLRDVADPSRRRELLDGLGNWPWLTRFRTDGAHITRTAMLDQIQSTQAE
jgi:precorrin-2 dehydrogenase / sirohydrochlorin ferrochelatase